MTVAKHLTACLAALAVTLVAVVADGRAAQSSGTGVKLSICSTNAKPKKRAAQFRAFMVPRKGSVRMGMRTRLFRVAKVAASDAEPAPVGVNLKSWGPWIVTDRPGAIGLNVTRRVDNLTGPAAYYIRVQMRWYNKRGAIVAEERFTSGACSQPNYGPDLAFGEFDLVAAGEPPSAPVVAGQSSGPTTAVPERTFTPGEVVTIPVRNTGYDPSRPATLTVRAGNAVVATSAVPAIVGGGATSIGVTLSACPVGVVLAAQLTAAAADSEPSYSNNSAPLGRCAS